MFKRLAEKFSQFRRRSDGVAAIEMAFIFPVMIILYFGLVDITDGLSANRRVTIAASTIADLVTQEPGSTNTGNLQGFYRAIQPIMDPYPSSSVGIQVFDYRIVGNVISLRWRHQSGPTCGSAPEQAEITSFNKLMTELNDIVVTRVCVTVEPITRLVFDFKPFNLEEQFALRPRQSLTLTCSNCPSG